MYSYNNLFSYFNPVGYESACLFGDGLALEIKSSKRYRQQYKISMIYFRLIYDLNHQEDEQ